ncbi:MAG: mandelate racemase/muconate lactonizing enzyme family protein, partial [Planctomycetales bacterium]
MRIGSVTPYIVGHVRNFFFLLIETDEGHRGIGEGGITWRERSAEALARELSEQLIGEDPFRTEFLWQKLYRSGFFPLGREGAAVLSAIDIALWDIKAQALNVPLYQLLGGLCREKVVCYPHIVGDSPAKLAEAAVAKVREGWKFVRFDPRPEPDGVHFEGPAAIHRCVEDVAAVREAVGPGIQIIVDFHTRFSPAEAIRLCQLLEPYDLFFVEDPIRMENFDSFRKLARQIRVPLAAGEQYASKWEFRQQVEEDLIDYARIDLCNAGGMTESLKIAHWCETHYIQLAPHNPLGPVSTAAGLHLDLACDNFGVQELARVPGQVLPELFPIQAPFENGHLLPPTRPGLGVLFDETA